MNTTELTGQTTFTRNCPKCSKELKYKTTANKRRADKAKSLCKSCKNKIYAITVYNCLTRKCPSCSKDIKYANIHYKLKADSLNSVCHNCALRTNPIICPDNLIRKCPQCCKDIKYTTRNGYIYGELHSVLCYTCSPRYKDYFQKVGNKYGKLTVIEQLDQNQPIRWKCKCDCGNIVIKKSKALCNRHNNSKTSCGCHRIKLPNSGAAINRYCLEYKKSAKKRGLSFELSMDEFKLLISKNCFYCGISPSNLVNKRYTNGVLVNGIDRIDSNIGYTTTNVVPCCKECNYAKRTLTKDKFLGWVKRIACYQFNLTIN